MKSKLIGVILAISFCALIQSGCVSAGGDYGSTVTQGQKNAIVKGQTTKVQILRELGNPDQVIDLGNNREQISYIKESIRAKGSLIGSETTSTFTEFWIILENGIVVETGERPTTKQPNYFK